MSARYEPERVEQPDGSVVEHYGAAHAARTTDARVALDEIAWAGRLVVTTIHCGIHRGRHAPLLGRVFRTLGHDAYVVVLEQQPRIPRALVDLMHDRADLRNQHGQLLDILTAPSDRDLECSACRCGVKLIDRAALLAAVRQGQDVFHV